MINRQWCEHLSGSVTSHITRGFIKIQGRSLFICTDFFSICRGFDFNQDQKPFHTDRYGRWRSGTLGLFYQAFYDSGSNYTLLAPYPPHGPYWEIYAPCCGFMQDLCVWAMRKVKWAHAENMQAFVAILLFFPGSLDSFWKALCCWIILHSCRNNIGHIAFSFEVTATITLMRLLDLT